MSFTHLTTTERSESHKLRVTNTLSTNTDERHRVYLPDTAAKKMKTRCKQAKVIFQSVSPETLIEVEQCLEQPCW